MKSQNDTSEQIFYDSFLLSQRDSEDVVSDIIESIILNGAKIIHTNYLKMQINPYTAKTIGQELIMNVMWAKLPLGDELNELEGLPDEDLELPKIDSWANGSLTVVESIPLRSSCIQELDEPKAIKKDKNESQKKANQNDINDVSEKVPNQEILSPKNALKSTKFPSKNPTKAIKKTSEALIIQKINEQTKKSNVKNITMDSDFNIIEIAEHKTFTSSLIVPTVTTKRLKKDDPRSQISKPKRRIPIQRRETKIQKKPLPKLLQADNPSFEDEPQNVSVVDQFVCSPGVTFKEGALIKSRPAPAKPNELTRAQYQDYLKEFKNNSKGDFIE